MNEQELLEAIDDLEDEKRELETRLKYTEEELYSIDEELEPLKRRLRDFQT